MKKIYINPKMEVVDLKINQHLMAGSPIDTPVGGGQQGNGSALAPSLDWDDDEDDEY